MRYLLLFILAFLTGKVIVDRKKSPLLRIVAGCLLVIGCIACIIYKSESPHPDTKSPQSSTYSSPVNEGVTSTIQQYDSLKMFAEDQFFMAENDIEHGVMLKMYETMDRNFPPKGSVRWKDGKYYNANDIVWEEHSYGPLPTMTYKVQVLRDNAKPLRPANPFANELRNY